MKRHNNRASRRRLRMALTRLIWLWRNPYSFEGDD
jgi:hypothetical protein